MAGEGVGGLLDHKGLLVEVEGFLWSACSSFFARWFLFFQRLILLSVRFLRNIDEIFFVELGE